MKQWFSALSTPKQYAVVFVAGFFVLLVVAVAAGGGSTTTKTVTDRAASDAALRAVQVEIKQDKADAQAEVEAAEAKVSDARDDLADAKGVLSEERAKVRAERKKLAKLQGQTSSVRATIARNSFDGEGTYVVGDDVSPGTYRAAATDNCYWARLSSLNTSDIIDNNNSSGPVVMEIQASDKAIQVSGCGTFHKAG
jgi:uncharacterized protein YlxW (UPF0749 family)